ncbi:unnamed protein product, partial [Prorocentrum cordatum]
MPRGHGVGLFAGQAVAASFQAAAPSGLGPPMQQTIGGVPFMCYKDDEAAASVTAREQVKQIARLAGPGAGPADTQPLLLSMPGAAAGSPAGA